jgi:hypothetical protein
MTTQEQIEEAYRRGFQHGFNAALDAIQMDGKGQRAFRRAVDFQNGPVADFRNRNGLWRDGRQSPPEPCNPLDWATSEATANGGG